MSRHFLKCGSAFKPALECGNFGNLAGSLGVPHGGSHASIGACAEHGLLLASLTASYGLLSAINLRITECVKGGLRCMVSRLDALCSSCMLSFARLWVGLLARRCPR